MPKLKNKFVGIIIQKWPLWLTDNLKLHELAFGKLRYEEVSSLSYCQIQSKDQVDKSLVELWPSINSHGVNMMQGAGRLEIFFKRLEKKYRGLILVVARLDQASIDLFIKNDTLGNLIGLGKC